MGEAVGRAAASVATSCTSVPITRRALGDNCGRETRMTTRPSALPACWKTWSTLFREGLRDLEPLSLPIAALALLGTAVSLALTLVALAKQR